MLRWVLLLLYFFTAWEPFKWRRVGIKESFKCEPPILGLLLKGLKCFQKKILFRYLSVKFLFNNHPTLVYLYILFQITKLWDLFLKNLAHGTCGLLWSFFILPLNFWYVSLLLPGSVVFLKYYNYYTLTLYSLLKWLYF